MINSGQHSRSSSEVGLNLGANVKIIFCIIDFYF